ncbi:hypothetical protein LP316_02645 [Thalassotalea sp. LPB0316]|uniref:putative metalloprotease CJM1_0395 family protein n=1 Tax=Thalassotalea sp. LPB0316 TaxID=2769490 RepID=UPI00186835B6|nr:putative metalloprotease CJM1_0395 family protein [Thalassotalea sp. LPB0316]QOL26218.1 hypothetical protein LP316_02645 [Thalassotalea sp. LPB0316]
MNITPQATQLPLATVVNPQTDSLRRENVQREVITQPVAVKPSLAEQKPAGDKERARTPGQLNEQVDFAQLEKNAAQAKATINGQQEQNSEQNPQQQQNQDPSSEDSGNKESAQPSQEQVVEQKVIEQMKARDTEVRLHEQAHDAVGGSYTGAPSYTYQTGPDGKRYIVDGEVSVDLSKIPNDPQATIVKMRKVYSAALAPAEPSAQDRRVAQKANKAIVEAQAELRAEKTGMSEAKSSSIGPNKVDLDKQGSIESDELFAESSRQQSKDFDQFINETLASQETIAPSQDSLFSQRANVINSFYSNIGNAYDRPPRSQFELTA